MSAILFILSHSRNQDYINSADDFPELSLRLGKRDRIATVDCWQNLQYQYPTPDGADLSSYCAQLQKS
ncbi:MAG TPA: hypothetical protein V6D25_26215 [Leptolyngbyaceae cyanobacterium]